MPSYTTTHREESHTVGPHVESHQVTTHETHHGGAHSAGNAIVATVDHSSTNHPVLAVAARGNTVTSHHGSSYPYNQSNSMTLRNGVYHGDGRIISTVTGEARATGQSHVIATRSGEARYTGETRVVEQYQSGSHVVDTRVVGVEKGAQRQVSVTEVEVGEEIIGEHTITTGKGRRGKKVVREEIIEKVIVVPETVQIEEWVEDEYDMEETVIEIAKKYQIEKIVEVPEIEIVEKVIEQIEKVIREKIVEIPVIQTVEKIIEVPIIQTVEKIVEVPEVQYRDIPVERIVEVPEYKTEEVIREVKRANFVDKPVEQKKLIVDAKVHKRRLPVPVEAETIVEFTVPHLRANYVKKKFPVYLPRFIEVPVSRQFVDAGAAHKNEAYAARLRNLVSTTTPVSLCEIEKLASEYREFEIAHRFTDRKVQLNGRIDETTKRTMFQGHHHTGHLEQYAIYKHLPVEVSDVHLGHYNQSHLGSAITYSSSSFGTHASLTSGSYHTTAYGATGGYSPTRGIHSGYKSTSSFHSTSYPAIQTNYSHKY